MQTNSSPYNSNTTLQTTPGSGRHPRVAFTASVPDSIQLVTIQQLASLPTLSRRIGVACRNVRPPRVTELSDATRSDKSPLLRFSCRPAQVLCGQKWRMVAFARPKCPGRIFLTYRRRAGGMGWATVRVEKRRQLWDGATRNRRRRDLALERETTCHSVPRVRDFAFCGEQSCHFYVRTYSCTAGPAGWSQDHPSHPAKMTRQS